MNPNDPIKLPAYIVAALKKGIKLYKAGHGGDGLQPETVRMAERGIESGEWPVSKILKAAAWFARHEADRDRMSDPADWDKPPKYSPAFVAWLLWGSGADDRGRKWIEEKAEKIKAADSEMYAEESDPSTPAPPQDRIKGSEKNPEGSAAADGGDIEVSPAVEKSLQGKVDAHNDRFADKAKRTTLAVLLKVYRRGAGAFSTSHRPGVSRAAWAMARVNAFLYLLANGKPKNPNYITDNDLLPKDHPRSTKGEKMNKEQYAEPDNVIEYSEGDIHAMRLGDLYDVDTGELILELTEELAREISDTTMKVIESGHVVPISLEHGIETGYRGDPGSDRRPYGQVTRVYYMPEDNDEGRPAGIYASKQWTKIGVEFVSSAKMAGGHTALRVSPRVKFGPAYHPRTGEKLGNAWFDVLAVTVLPRQDSLAPLEMSRAAATVDTAGNKVLEENEQFDRMNETPIDIVDGVGDVTATDEGSIEMAKNETKENVEAVVLMNRGDAAHVELFGAAGIPSDGNVSDVVLVLKRNAETITELTAKVDEYKAAADERARLELAAEVDALLGEHDFANDAEREFFRDLLMSDDTAERAREVLASRNKRDEMEDLDAAVVEAKEQGKIPADFDVDAIKEFSRGSVEVVAKVLEALPVAATVRTGEPAGTAVTVSSVDYSRDAAAAEISKIAREKAKTDNIELRKAIRLVQNERADLMDIVRGEK